MSDTPYAIPLIELLKDVPIDGSDCYPISSVHHKNIPYGELCHAAAKEIEQLERERDEARDDCERLNRLLRHETALGQGEIDHWAALERERDGYASHLNQVCDALGMGEGYIAVDAAIMAAAEIKRLKESVESLRDQLCADKCRDKAAADGGWANI